jgi:cell division protein FtsQ
MNSPIKFLSFLLLLIILSTYTPNHKNKNKSLIFPITEISVENTKFVNSKKIITALQYLEGKNLLFLDKQKIKSTILEFNFISSFEVKKIYPKTLKIIVFEKEPIAIFVKGKNKFYISNKGDLINYVKFNNYKDLPLVFGKEKNFNIFFEELKDLGFSINNVKSFHYFDLGRWDIVLKNNRLIKLPKNNYIEKLKNFILINNNKSFDKYKIFDYRIKDQLILN